MHCTQMVEKCVWTTDDTTRWLQDVDTKQARTHASLGCVENAVESMLAARITHVAQQLQVCNCCNICKHCSKIAKQCDICLQESPASAKGTCDSSACMKAHCEQM